VSSSAQPQALLDTHVVIWLFEGQLDRIPARVQTILESHALAISPMVALELGYLYEVGRTAQPPAVVLAELQRSLGLTTADTPFPEVVRAALLLDWTRDPFDRLIAAQAIAEDLPLVTADHVLLSQVPSAVWR
jgi:PIN domain nuclease of toxin-antitoxin system